MSACVRQQQQMLLPFPAKRRGSSGPKAVTPLPGWRRSSPPPQPQPARRLAAQHQPTPSRFHPPRPGSPSPHLVACSPRPLPLQLVPCDVLDDPLGVAHAAVPAGDEVCVHPERVRGGEPCESWRVGGKHVARSEAPRARHLARRSAQGTTLALHTPTMLGAGVRNAAWQRPRTCKKRSGTAVLLIWNM